MIYIIDCQLQFNEEDKIANKGDMIYFDQSSEPPKAASDRAGAESPLLVVF